MAATSTFTWNGSSSTWNSTANWGAVAGSTATTPSFNSAASPELFILGGSSAYTVTLGAPAVLAGAVTINDASAVLSLSSNELETSNTAITTGAGGTLDVAAGEITLAGTAVLAFYETTVTGEIIGNGKITTVSSGNTGFENGFLTTTGSGEIVANGALTIAGASGNAEGLNNVSGSFGIDSGATLNFSTDSSLGTTSSGSVATVNFQSNAGTVETTSATAGATTQFSSLGSETYEFNATLENLAVGQTNQSTTGASVITLNGQTITSASISGNTIIANTSGATFEFATNGTFTGDYAQFSGNQLWIDAVCFAAGTRVLTDRGEVVVEDLAAGDMVVTLADGGQVSRPVTWIGHRRLDLAKHHQPNLAAPVRVRAGALGDCQPSRDLLVSPDHCLFLDGMLIPAKLLINDMTIVQERDTRVVTYYHVQLERHSVLLAEGAPAESYLDTGNRAFFSNAGLALMLHPDFEVNANLKCWETDACAPLAVSAEIVKPIHDRLADRAESLGYHRQDVATSTEPELRLVADGRVIRPLSSDANRYVFTLPAGVSSVRLTSRASVPSYFEAYLDDWRQLGVAVRRIVVRDSAGLIELPPDHPGLTQGWHKVEHDDATMWRWTNGDAVLPIGPTQAPTLVEIQVGMVMKHAVQDAAQDRLAA